MSFALQRPMTFARQALGLEGESLICQTLERRGYAILARRYRTRAGEIDIIARRADWVVFVEVKTRTGAHFGDPATAVTAQKRRRLVAMAEDFVTRHRLTHLACRFDVAAIDLGQQPAAVTIIEDAFRPGWA